MTDLRLRSARNGKTQHSKAISYFSAFGGILYFYFFFILIFIIIIIMIIINNYNIYNYLAAQPPGKISDFALAYGQEIRQSSTASTEWEIGGLLAKLFA